MASLSADGRARVAAGQRLAVVLVAVQGLQQINLESFVIPGDDPGSMVAHPSPAWIAGQARNDNAGDRA